MNILIFGQLKITNLGDPIIADCCKYLIEKAAKETGKNVKVSMAKVYKKHEWILKWFLRGKDAVVFPGGGMNSVVSNEQVLRILRLIEKTEGVSVYFNAIGILRKKPKAKNEKLLVEIFNKDIVKQVTTRGDLAQLKTYITQEKPYETKLVLDPAMWVNEAYGIEKDPEAKVIGIGVIRPDIFKSNGNKFSPEAVKNMYKGIICELEARGYQWKLFSNGMPEDYQFAVSLLEELGLDKERYIGKNVYTSEQLVKKIAGFRAVIAARLHANIIASSLRIPSVGLVWNDKMNLFADSIGVQGRYLEPDRLSDPKNIVDAMEKAICDGYDEQCIRQMKEITEETYKNMLK